MNRLLESEGGDEDFFVDGDGDDGDDKEDRENFLIGNQSSIMNRSQSQFNTMESVLLLLVPLSSNICSWVWSA